MLLKQNKFDHTRANFRLALNIPVEVMSSAIEKIIFSTASNAIAADEMYDSKDVAPQELTTVTGDLQKTLNMANEELEYETMLLLFRHYHELTRTAVKHYMSMHGKEADKEKADIIKKLTKLMIVKDVLENDDEDDENSEAIRISFKNMLERISLVKKSNYNFDRYIKYVSRYNSDDYIEKITDGGDQD